MANKKTTKPSSTCTVDKPCPLKRLYRKLFKKNK